LQAIVNTGVAFINFLGHSGGRVWGVDIGSPDDLQNTTGRLPFVSSVSCNVGAFSEPSSNVLSEDFILADNRGAIGVWSSASLAYASVGSSLVNNFFGDLTADSMRDFGALTTLARVQLWQRSGADYITLAAVNLTPLLGDPLSRLALPLLPDLAAHPADLYLNSRAPTPADTMLSLTALIHNYGLVPADSVMVLLTDNYQGEVTPLLNNVKIRPTRFRDSLVVPWRGTKQVGLHAFQLTLDPANLISEVTKSNNVAASEATVYANLLYVVRPLPNMLVPAGPQTLRVTSPIGVDSAAMQISFQVDTGAAFASPALLSSPAVSPGPVSAEWTTPPLADGTVYYWRARSSSTGVNNPWVTSTFRTGGGGPALPAVRWSESSPVQFGAGMTAGTAVTDSGVTVAGRAPSRLYVRSLGARADANRDYYSVVKLDDQTMFGLWWEQGTGFLALRFDPVSRAFVFRAFDVPGHAAQADSMQAFLASTPTGNFIGLSVIFDGRTNVTAGLRGALKSLGSVLIDSVQSNDAWSMIAEQGGGVPPLEHWSAGGITADRLVVQNAYSGGTGTFAGELLPMPQRWRTFRWDAGGPPGTTEAHAAIVGIRTDSGADTLRVIPRDSVTADLSGLAALTANPAYVSFRAVALLSSIDARSTPVLRSWSADFEPPADLAVSSHTVRAPKIRLPAGIATASVTLDVYNIGYRQADSARVVLSYLQPDNALRPLATAALDSIPAGGK
ncbi:MAG TPA: C25 family cysteine peptidase, partial [Bacteroidota bacterium]|nr:C25 family cysteine peptidase [Bacteroidota bacterium]